MTHYIILDDNNTVWDYDKHHGTWWDKNSMVHKTGAEILTTRGGQVYASIDQRDVPMPKLPEPQNIGSIYNANGAIYVRYSYDDREPWICTRTGIKFAWKDIV